MGSFVVYHYVKNCDKAHLFIGKKPHLQTRDDFLRCYN